VGFGGFAGFGHGFVAWVVDCSGAHFDERADFAPGGFAS
jgi:hypothetical protein